RLREALPQNVYALQNDSIKIGDYVICGTRGWTCPEGDNLSEQDQKIYNREALRLEMSLKNMSKIRNEGDTAISLMHFPPFNSRREQSLFTQLFQKYNIDSVVYGHIHGSVSRADKYIEKCGIKYYLTSCDMLSNIPVKIY
ncbi:MAG: metallophosphoesterase, partial [Clostridia bacterium]|nr:metallophosphoesterase [Clostridia bacterium]